MTRARTLCQIAVGLAVAGALTACSSSVPGVAEASDLAAGIQSVVESTSAEVQLPATIRILVNRIR